MILLVLGSSAYSARWWLSLEISSLAIWYLRLLHALPKVISILVLLGRLVVH
jgi:hypothetical protein